MSAATSRSTCCFLSKRGTTLMMSASVVFVLTGSRSSTDRGRVYVSTRWWLTTVAWPLLLFPVFNWRSSTSVSTAHPASYCVFESLLVRLLVSQLSSTGLDQWRPRSSTSSHRCSGSDRDRWSDLRRWRHKHTTRPAWRPSFHTLAHLNPSAASFKCKT